MEGLKRFLTGVTAAVLLSSASVFAGAAEYPEGFEEAEMWEEYQAQVMWLSEAEGTVNLYDREEKPLELEMNMRMEGGKVLETAEESLAVVDMDRERLAIMDENSRAGFEAAEQGNQISIALQNGAMYFRIGIPLEEKESFEIQMGDIILAIRGTCGMAEQSEEGGLSIILASGHAAVRRVTEEGEEAPEETEIEAGERLSVTAGDAEGEIRFVTEKLKADEVPGFLVKAFRKDPIQLERVYAETGWKPEALFGDDIPVWMPVGEKLDGLPDEWIGRVLGCGGWYEILDYLRFPSKTEMVDGMNNEIGSEYTRRITYVQKYTEHFWGIGYKTESGNLSETGIFLPGLTEEELRELLKSRKMEQLASRRDEILRNRDRYAILSYGVGQISVYAITELAFYDDITATGIEGAKPFMDYEPCGYTNFLPIGKHPAEFPDSLVGKKLVNVGDPYLDGSAWEAMWEFLSKDTVRYTMGLRKAGESEAEWVGRANQEGMHVRQETWTLRNAFWISDHMIEMDFEEPGPFEWLMTLPGMSAREVQYCREVYLYLNMWENSIEDSASRIDGNNYCMCMGEVQIWEVR